MAFRSVDVLVTVDAPYPLDAETPVGDEPTLPATSDRTATVCRPPTTEGASCFDYDTPLYLRYGAAADARVDLNVSFEGRNEWFAGGWAGNHYRETVGHSATGVQSGWVTADGHLVVAEGNYPSP